MPDPHYASPTAASTQHYSNEQHVPTGRGLKSFFTRVTSPTPGEAPAGRSRFKSFMGDAASKTGPGSKLAPTRQGNAGQPTETLGTRRRTLSKDVHGRSSAADQTRKGSQLGPSVPTVDMRKHIRFNPNVLPRLQKGDDGKWQPPSLSRGSMSTSALHQMQEQDPNVVPTINPKKGPQHALSGLFHPSTRRKSSVPATYKKAEDDLARTTKSPARGLKTKVTVEDLQRTISPGAVSPILRTPRTPVSPMSVPAPPTSSVAPPSHRPPQSPPSSKPPQPASQPTVRVSQSTVRRPTSLPAPLPPPDVPTHARQASDIAALPPAATPPLSREHYLLRLSTSFIVKSLTPVVRGSSFVQGDKGSEIRRLADERLAVLVRMEKAWGSDWVKAAGTLNDSQPGQAQAATAPMETRIRAAYVGERAKERERKAWLEAMRDGILLCFLFNHLFPYSPAHITRVNISEDGINRSTNVTRFIAACQTADLQEGESFELSDLKGGSELGLGKVAASVVALARIAGPSRSKSPVGSRPASRPGSRMSNATPTNSPPPTPKQPIFEITSPSSMMSAKPATSFVSYNPPEITASVSDLTSPFHVAQKHYACRKDPESSTDPQSDQLGFTANIGMDPFQRDLLGRSYVDQDGARMRERRMSGTTLQNARQKILGTLLSSEDLPEDLRNSVTNNSTNSAEDEALMASLAALEGRRASPRVKTDSTPRPRPSNRRCSTREVARQEVDPVKEEDEHTQSSGSPRIKPSLTLTPTSSERPERVTRVVSPSGKFYIPKRSISPASNVSTPTGVAFAHLSSGSPTPELSSTHFSDRLTRGTSPPPQIVSRAVPPTERGTRHHSFTFVPASQEPISPVRPRQPRNSSMVDVSSKSMLSREASPSGAVKSPRTSQSLQVLEFHEKGEPVVRYQLGNCIGRGQFGSVYRSLNLGTGQMSAIKRIRLFGMPENEVKDVMREVELLRRLSHPSIVKYEGMSRDDQYLNIVLEFVENGSLGQTLKAFGTFNEQLVSSYVAKILEGLNYLHSQGVVHCDLKSANILSTKTGNIKLSDFGVSLNMKALENMKQEAKTAGKAGARHASEVAGTPNWMAPEVISLAGASFSSDIWSLGCTVIELLTGKPPYSDVHNSMTVLFRIVEDEMPPLPSGISDDLADFLRLCFTKDPDTRPSAAVLFEHRWLTSLNPQLTALRSQDSLPFLSRVSMDFRRTSSTQLFQQSDATPETVAPEPPATPVQKEANTPTKAHVLVKTTFGKAIACRVCDSLVKKGVLCQDCGMIAHTSCESVAMPKCDVHEQLAILKRQQEQQTSEIRGGTGTPTPRASFDGRDGHFGALPGKILLGLKRSRAFSPPRQSQIDLRASLSASPRGQDTPSPSAKRHHQSSPRESTDTSEGSHNDSLQNRSSFYSSTSGYGNLEEGPARGVTSGFQGDRRNSMAKDNRKSQEMERVRTLSGVERESGKSDKDDAALGAPTLPTMKGARFLLPALAKTLFLPPLIVFLLFRALPFVPLALEVVAYISSFPVLFILRSQLSAELSARSARQLRAVDIPRVQGRWPLNLDVLWDWAKSGSEEEVGRMMVLMERRYGGTYNTRVLGEDQIMTTDPRVFRHVLIGDFDNFVKGQKFKDRAQEFLGDGIFNSDGQMWRHHRSLLRPFFHPTFIRPSRFSGSIDDYIFSIQPGKPFDMQAELGQLSLRMSIMWLCGTDLTPELGKDHIAEWKEAQTNIGQAMSDAQRVVGKRVKIGTLWPLFELAGDPLKKPMKTIRTFFGPIISQALERKEELSNAKDDSAYLLIDRLVHAIDNRKDIEDQLINILLASRDTRLARHKSSQGEANMSQGKKIKLLTGDGDFEKWSFQVQGLLMRKNLRHTLRATPVFFSFAETLTPSQEAQLASQAAALGVIYAFLSDEVEEALSPEARDYDRPNPKLL
ncbi:hypothetical protein B9479_001718 [Cryptococcus floricola]|uniref:Protein kinase domain-containing protein n=1 Tax=Cryptococcus floricola TaxID=2591691 RepID=A0A5D3B5R8_9TREE|nr:hypothetical protein B9479_001718 [Cryptococcus floricola]